MKSENQMEQVVGLTKLGEIEEAATIIIQSCKEGVVGKLLRRGYWTEVEAVSFFNEAVIKSLKLIIENNLDYLKCAYVHTIANYDASNEYRKRQSKDKVYINELTSDVAIKNNPYRDIIRTFDGYDLSHDDTLKLRAFNKLSDKCKKHILFVKFDKIKHMDIPKHMNNITNANSSKTMLNRCMKRLKDILKEMSN